MINTLYCSEYMYNIIIKYYKNYYKLLTIN